MATLIIKTSDRIVLLLNPGCINFVLTENMITGIAIGQDVYPADAEIRTDIPEIKQLFKEFGLIDNIKPLDPEDDIQSCN